MVQKIKCWLGVHSFEAKQKATDVIKPFFPHVGYNVHLTIEECKYCGKERRQIDGISTD